MADEVAYDEISFKMVDGDTFTMRKTAGSGRAALNEGFEGLWVTIDNTTRIRTDKIVSIHVHEHDEAESRIL